MPIKVLIISFWNPVEGKPQQGIFIQDQAIAVSRLRNDLLFVQVNILPSQSLFLKTDISDSEFYGNRKLVISFRSFFWKILFITPWLISKMIIKIIEEKYPGIQPSLIHSNVIFPCGFAGYYLSLKTRSKLIISEHWSKAENFMSKPITGKSAIKIYNKNLAIICVSEFLAEKIRKSTGHKNVIVIHNIVDTEIFNYVPKTEKKNRPVVFTCVATWNKPKRLDLLIESLSEYAEKSAVRLTLNVVGNGPQAEFYKKHPAPANLAITWHGYLAKTDIAKILQKTDVFLHASDTETFSIVTAEALSTGTPAIVSNKGALPGLIHERNGLLAENNTGSWTKKIEEIINKEFNYKEISGENQERFSPETIGSHLNEIYNKALTD